MAHGDVLITHNDALKSAKTSKESTVIASARTLKQMTSPQVKQADLSNTDPWLTHDPRRQPSAKASQPMVTPAQLANMQSTIEQNLRNTIAIPEDVPMAPAQEARAAALEDQVKQLTSNVTQLTGSFNTLNTQQHQLGSQVQKLKTHMDSQHAA